MEIKTTEFQTTLFVVYFDQLLGAAHPKSWSKSSFSAKKAEKSEKNKKFAAKFINLTTIKVLHIHTKALLKIGFNQICISTW